MVHISIPLITGFTVPVLTAWLAGQLPKKGEPWPETEKKIRNIALSIMVGFGASYLVMQLTEQPEEREMVSAKLLPKY